MNFSKLQATSKIADEWRYPQAKPRRSDLLPVEQQPAHKLYWEEYGDPAGEPVMVLHGGPGAACSPVMARFFDPARYRVILFDQRGCGLSEPTVADAGPAVALARNTTDDLVEDINRLRDALDIKGPMHVFGGSWGSTLALVYAIRYPANVASLILRGIFLGRREDLDYLYQGNAETFAVNPVQVTLPGAYICYPDEWRRLVEVVPPDQRADLMAAYKRLFDLVPATDAERDHQRDAVIAWSLWEGVVSNLIPEAASAGKFGEYEYALCFAQIEAHYFAHNLFLPENYILANAGRLAGLPVHIVHGRFDQVCPLNQASELAQALGAIGNPPATYVITAAGHSAMERENALALTAIMDGLPGLEG